MNKEQKAPPSEVANPERRAFLAWTSIWSVGALVLPLAGCGSGIAQEVQNVAYTIDTSIQSPSQDSRVRTLVLHYTAETLADSIALLTDPQRRSVRASCRTRPTVASASVSMHSCRKRGVRGMPA